MAKDTAADRGGLVIYEVFVRNHGANGTFREVEEDLGRIRALGVDVVWLMPVHPIGKLGRKGGLGSPYSVRNYYQVDRHYGTLEDLSRLLEAAHTLGLSVMMDIVFNHAARDSVLVKQYPAWFATQDNYRNALPDWTDVLAFNHEDRELRSYLIDVLSHWANFGMDGFRCDVASFLPLAFWLEARRRLDETYPGLIWLAESADLAYVAERRNSGLPALTDNELFAAFDITYDHEALPIWRAVLNNRVPLARYAEILRMQDAIYPANFVKLRAVENHDQARIMASAPTREQALAWTAFQAFNKGAFLIYAGQEAGASHRPSLFDRDPIAWRDYSLQPFLTRLTNLKKDPVVRRGRFVITDVRQTLQAAWQCSNGGLYGVFDVNNDGVACRVPLPDSDFEDLLSGAKVEVRRGACLLPRSAVILRYQEPLNLKPFHSDLLDYPERCRDDTSVGQVTST